MRLPGGERGCVGERGVDDDVDSFADRIVPGIGRDLEGERVRDLAEPGELAPNRAKVLSALSP